MNKNDFVQALYIGYYGRPADVEGLNYWISRFSKDDSSQVLRDFADSYESEKNVLHDQSGASIPSSQLIHNIYDKLFGRQAAEAEYQYYKHHLDEKNKTLIQITEEIVRTTNDMGTGEDLVVFNNKIDIASFFTSESARLVYSEEHITAAGSLIAGRIRDKEPFFEQAQEFLQSLDKSIPDKTPSSEDDSVVYWASREIWFPVLGQYTSHHFLRIEPSNPEEYPIAQDFTGDGRPDGFTIGGTITNPGLFSLTGELTGELNATHCLEAVREGKWGYQEFRLQLPEEITYDELSEDLLLAYISYMANISEDPVIFTLVPTSNTDDDAGNCASWANSILQASGLGGGVSEMVDDHFDRLNVGHKHLIDLEYFKNDQVIEMGIEQAIEEILLV